MSLLEYAEINYDLTELEICFLRLLEQDGQTWSKVIAPIDHESIEALRIYEEWKNQYSKAC